MFDGAHQQRPLGLGFSSWGWGGGWLDDEFNLFVTGLFVVILDSGQQILFI